MLLGLLLVLGAIIIGGGILQAIWNQHHPKNDQYYQGALDLSNTHTYDDDNYEARIDRLRKTEPWKGF